MKYLTLLLIPIFLLSCGGVSSGEQPLDTTDSELTTKTEESPKPEPVKVEKTTAELLQGKWQHVKDKSNFLVFEKGLRKEIADGMKTWDEEAFVLSDHCINTSDKKNDIPKEDNKYISCAKSDLCWYIVSVDADNLELSYMGRGNTLSYTRAKE